MFANAAERKGLSFSIKSSGLPAAVQGDPLRITQILMNLSANALRFTEKGSVTVEALYRDGACTFSVTDTGIGMRREERERLFMPFQQAKRETARKFGGTGLGLSISAHLAELMQSHIDVESTEGKGSSFRFKVSLPETNASAIAANAESEVDAAFAQRIPLRILVVDDTDVNRMLTIAMLEKLGFQNIGECDDGFKAVDAILTGAYDVVLLDVQMPGMDGTEVARLVKDRMRKPPRLVAVTGNVETEDRQTYLKTMDDYIPKPFTFAMLMAALSRA
ncbi:ATP-binding protein [Turneriella parva]|nr:ATP-binding protein [Turneriella parva]